MYILHAGKGGTDFSILSLVKRWDKFLANFWGEYCQLDHLFSLNLWYLKHHIPNLLIAINVDNALFLERNWSVTFCLLTGSRLQECMAICEYSILE